MNKQNETSKQYTQEHTRIYILMDKNYVLLSLPRSHLFNSVVIAAVVLYHHHHCVLALLTTLIGLVGV